MEKELKQSSFSNFVGMMNIFKKTAVNQSADKMVLENEKIQKIDYEKEIENEKKVLNQEIDFIISSENKEQMNLLKEQGVVFSWQHLQKIIYQHPKLHSCVNADVHIQKYSKQLISDLNGIFINIQNLKIQDPEYREEFKSQNKKLLENFSFLRLMVKFNGTSQLNELFQKENHHIEEIYKNIILVSHKKEEIEHCAQKHSFYPSIFDEENSPFKQLLEAITKAYNEKNKEKITSIAQRYKMLSLNDDKNVQQNIEKILIDKNSSFSDTLLNPQAQEIYQDIKELFLQIQKNELAKLDELELENISSKKIPRILGEYLSIPKNYREKLKDDVESPDKLLVSSLKQIKNSLMEMNDKIQQSNVDKMKVTNRYLKTM